MGKFTLEDGKYLVDVARKTIDKSVKANAIVIHETQAADKFKEKMGVFVTILKGPKHELRGCVGVPMAERPLIVALKESATNAALSDHRFSQVKPEELNDIIVEVTVLTPPELIKVDKLQDYPKEIEIGKDGLFIEAGSSAGLLLPQVATEMKLDADQFLGHLAMKAGMGWTDWMVPGTKIYKFQGQLFAEKTPHGEVVEKLISKK